MVTVWVSDLKEFITYKRARRLMKEINQKMTGWEAEIKESGGNRHLIIKPFISAHFLNEEKLTKIFRFILEQKVFFDGYFYWIKKEDFEIRVKIK